ncbi:TVP38/TMEM64 family protein [Gorillibacterium timonense]|uniref:TVP38/TMEM64 family protein n=1 Tax=Gorillibacterium timonense TaxID=1689269 RepID=UPI000AA97067|nr:TVP38/TMEM64 family protein [Gorillibacterium timonense]
MIELSYLTDLNEEGLLELLDRFRSFGPLPGIALPFLKSFIPPLPTVVLVTVNAAVYGLWLGVLYSWLGLVSGCLVTFLLVKLLSRHRFIERWRQKPRVQKSLRWIRRNEFSYVFLLSLFPVGPFVVINIAAGISGMRLKTFALALALGKALMVFMVSYIGRDIGDPVRLLVLALVVAVSIILVRKLEARFSAVVPEQEAKQAGKDLAQ